MLFEKRKREMKNNRKIKKRNKKKFKITSEFGKVESWGESMKNEK